MAFQSMMNGADCGPSNPLQNLLKHVDRDSQSGRHDSFAQPGPSRFRATGPGAAQQHRRDPDESRVLFDPTQRGRFGTESLMRELVAQAGGPTPSAGQAWSRQFGSAGPGSSVGPLAPEDVARMEDVFQQQQQRLMNATRTKEAHWAHDFNHSHQVENPKVNERSPSDFYNRPTGFGVGLDRFPGSRLGSFGLGYGSESYIGPTFNNSAVSINQDQKGKIVELSDENEEAEFAKVGQAPSTKPDEQAELRTSSIGLDTRTLEEALEKTDLTTETDDTDGDAAFLLSLENTWKNLASNLNSASLLDSDMAGWEREFGNLNDPDQFLNPNFTPENVGDFLNDPRPYPYQPENVFVDHPDPLEEGRRLIASGAPLSQAALAFEAACQLDESRGEAWRILGETQAADEKEHLAIKAFEKAIGCGGIDAQASWMSLAIAWVNEGHELRALATLERWLGDTYPNVASSVLSTQREPATHNPWDRHSRVVDMFLAAARAGPNVREGPGKEVVRSQVVDADVQVGLGVLFYSNSDYDRARDCFEAALGVNPGDFLLWNRLGATLANGGQPEQAIDAYRRALELRPTFTRAIYNLGVSCLNINCYKEAAEHLLAALSLHRKSNGTAPRVSDKHPLLPDGDGSDNLWHTLRRAFMCLDRQDLADRAVPGADVDSFRLDGFEF